MISVMFARVAHAWRSWKSAPAIASLAILALGVGIGSASAIFAVVNAILLMPLPYTDAERFVTLYGVDLNEPAKHSGLSYADVLQFQHRSRSFDVFGWFPYEANSVNLMFGSRPEHVNALPVTPTLLNMLGVRPLLGRWFKPDGDPAGYRTAVLSHSLWRRLGADPAIVGKSLTLDGLPITVTGVAPGWFHFPIVGVARPGEDNDLWLPLDPREESKNPTRGIYLGYARLRSGVTVAAANADIKRIAAAIARADSSNHPAFSARVEDLHASAVADVRPAILLTFAAAGLLFFITCANVAGLMLARSVARTRETAIRIALGATGLQLATQFFLEGLFVSLSGALLGLLLQSLLVRLIAVIAGEYGAFLTGLALDPRVLLFAFGLALLASILFSLSPLWQATSTSPGAVMSSGTRASATASARRLSRQLVVGEIALAFTLLGVSVLLLSQLSRLYRTSPGFDTQHLLTFLLNADEPHYRKLSDYQKKLLEAVSAQPGVAGVALSSELPLAGCCISARIVPDGETRTLNSLRQPNLIGVSPAYFAVMRIPLLRGRFLTEQDTNDRLVPVVIDQSAASYYWPGRDPIGASGLFSMSNGARFQVVGVVGTVRNESLGDPAVPELYLSNAVYWINPVHFFVRAPLPTGVLLPEIRRAILAVNPSQPVYDIRSVATVVQTSLALQRFSSWILALFAAVAVLLAALGIYGVVAYSVRQRTVELGTRMALGAQNLDVFRLILREGFQMAAFGSAIGIALIALAAWLLIHVLAVVREFTPGSFLYALLLVIAVVFAATFFPAWRATLLSPMVAIRDEPLSFWQTAGRTLREIFQSLRAPAQRVSEAQVVQHASLLSDFINAARQAANFDEAVELALGTLRERLGASTAMLLENLSGSEYTCLSAAPAGVAAPLPLPAPGFLSSRLRFYSLPLPIDRSDLATWARWSVENKSGHAAEIRTLAESDIRVAAPLRAKSEIFGLLLLGAPVDRPQYTRFELRLLRNCAEQFALLLENARLTGRVVEQEKLRRDVALAAEVQRRLLPQTPPDSPAVSFAAESLPARTVGGDYYDFLQVGEHRLGIALADIAGKGVAAALLMSVVQASLRIISAEEGISLPQLAAKMNRYLYRSTGVNGYATFFYAELDEMTRQLRYVNAGHNPPYLLRAASANEHATPESPAVEELATGGMIIGMFPQAKYDEGTLNLQPGDVLIVFTDGVTEALNPAGEEFGEERLKDLLLDLAHLPIPDLASQLSHQLRAWIAHADQHDDMTFLLMKVK